MSKIHFFTMISPTNKIMFENVVLLYNSIKICKKTNFKFSIIVPYDEMNHIPNKYKNFDYQPYFYKNSCSNPTEKYKHSPRWFCNPDPDCDTIVFLDHDTIMLKNIQDLESLSIQKNKIFAVQAYKSPFKESNDNWKLIFEKLEINYPKYLIPYNSSKQSNSFAPFYPNAGFILFSKKILEQIQNAILRSNEEIKEKIPHMLNNYFLQQIVITIAVYKHKIPFEIIDKKYNYIDNEFGDINDETVIYHYTQNKNLIKTKYKYFPEKFLKYMNFIKNIKLI